MKQYTLGVAFTLDNYVTLIRKTKPEWQAGSYNFVGGKIEPGEEPIACIQREFYEETGVDIDTWQYVGRMERPNDFVCYIFTVRDQRISNVETTTEETVILMAEEYFVTSNDLMISNLKTIHQFVKSADFANIGAKLLIEYPVKQL